MAEPGVRAEVRRSRPHGAPPSVLVVDDNALNREALCAQLRRRGYRATGAEDGERALALVAREPFDLVLLDVTMPGPSGFEVLEAIRRGHAPIDLPVIMATARDDSDDVVRGLELGASDYVTKPFDFPVVLARVHTHLSLKRSVQQVLDLEQRLSRRNQDLEAANGALRRALAAAARIQEAFLPHESINVPGASFAWAFEPCEELAGDSLNVCRLGEEQLGFYVLDVSGHGVAAALLSVTATRLLSSSADPNSILTRGAGGSPVPPAEVAEVLNRRFPWDEATGQFFTLFYATLHLRTRELRYVTAGHPAAVLVRPGEPPASLPETGGPPIGLGDRYEEQAVALRPGDRLYLYSDGVT
ncbi:MAG TPA: SpoIIE family protein phosphatase, partial [Gemmataceae bacterium]|nr:SpoIIE family protein phosphatase [Gemmataceae bacterium]